MSKLVNKIQTAARRFLSKRSLRSFVVKQPKARYFQIDLTPRRAIYITLRRFRTSSTRQSTIKIVLPVSVRGYKEVCFRPQTWKKHRRTNKQTRYVFSLSNGLIAIGTAGLIFFGLQFIHTSFAQPPVAFASQPAQVYKSTEKPKEQFLGFSAPVHIVIPAIGVDADTISVGLNTDKTIQTPDIFSHNVGWYDKSPSPGQQGPTVMVGHVDTYLGPSVFWRLGELLPDSEISILRSDGIIVTYLVKSVQQFSQDTFPTEQVYGDTAGAELRLITCSGSFSYISGQYSANTVVFAQMR